jgi:hypothetical protein
MPFNQNNMVAKVLLLPFFGLLQHFFGVDFDTKPCSANLVVLKSWGIDVMLGMD